MDKVNQEAQEFMQQPVWTDLKLYVVIYLLLDTTHRSIHACESYLFLSLKFPMEKSNLMNRRNLL